MTIEEKTVLLAERVMGWRRPTPEHAAQFDVNANATWVIEMPYGDTFLFDRSFWDWQPYKRLEHAWMIVRGMLARGWEWRGNVDGTGVWVCFWQGREDGYADNDAYTMPVAICEAAGRALNLWGEGE